MVYSIFLLLLYLLVIKKKSIITLCILKIYVINRSSYLEPHRRIYIDISVFSVCMNVVISATIKARYIKFGMKVSVYRGQIKFIINFVCHAHSPDKTIILITYTSILVKTVRKAYIYILFTLNSLQSNSE